MLLKQVFRNFMQRKVQLAGIAVMIFLSSMLYSMMSHSFLMIKEPTYDMLDNNNLEDFSIEITKSILPGEGGNCAGSESSLSLLKVSDESCYTTIINERIATIEGKYDVTLELREFKEVNYDHKYRIMNNMNELNQVYYTEGEAPSDGEVGINEYYAKENGLSVGDTILIGESNYTVSGYAYFPDYNLPFITGEPLTFDNTKQSFVAMSDADYASVTSFNKLEIHLAGVVAEGADELSTINKINDEYKNDSDLNSIILQDLVETSNQMRAGGIYAELDGGEQTAIGLASFISIIAVVIIGIVVSQIVRKERSQIGLLKALGFKKKDIIKPYVLLIIFISLPLLAGGYFVGKLASPSMSAMYQAFYIVPSDPSVFSFKVFATSIIFPLFMISLLVALIVFFMLKDSPIEMQKPKVNRDNFIVKRLAKKQSNDIKKKFKTTLAFKSIAKFYVFFIGILMSVFLLIFGLSMGQNMSKMSVAEYEEVNYIEQAYCLGACNKTDAPDATYSIEIPDISYEGTTLSLIGYDRENKLIPIKQERLLFYGSKDISDKINDDEVVITKALSVNSKLKVGDDLNLVIGDKELSLKITGIKDSYTSSNVYIDLDYLKTEHNGLFGGDSNYSNVVYSKTDLDDTKYAAVLDVSKLISQGEMMSEMMDTMIYQIVFSAMIFGGVILYIIMQFIVEDNYYSVSMLKVFGFNDEEVEDLVMNSFKRYKNIIFFASIPIAIVSLLAMQNLFASEFNMIMPIAPFNIANYIISFGVLSLTYYLSTRSSRKKLANISLQESMKLYQE